MGRLQFTAAPQTNVCGGSRPGNSRGMPETGVVERRACSALKISPPCAVVRANRYGESPPYRRVLAIEALSTRSERPAAELIVRTQSMHWLAFWNRAGRNASCPTL